MEDFGFKVCPVCKVEVDHKDVPVWWDHELETCAECAGLARGLDD